MTSETAHVLWSGGPASTWVIWQLLSQGRKVHAHHIRIGVFRSRDEAEHIAVVKLGMRLAELHPGSFTYSISRVDLENVSALFVFNIVDFWTHRNRVINFVACEMNTWPMYVGDRRVCDYHALPGFQYRTPIIDERGVYSLPDSIKELATSCFNPVITRGQKGAADDFRECGKCRGCKPEDAQV